MQDLLDKMVDIARDAGAAVMEIYNSDFAVDTKSDNSPVTTADEAAEAIILAGLSRIAPDIPVVAEEQASKGFLPEDIGQQFFLVDPLDGTKEFISRNGEFTVNIGLIYKGQPRLGVVFAPAVDRLYAGQVGKGAWRVRSDGWQPVHTRPAPQQGLVVVASRSHRDDATNAFIDTLTVQEVVSAGSSLKLCTVAEANADVYPRFGPTMEWDIAAGQAVLMAAGGTVVTPEGESFTYGKTDFRNGPFVAWGQYPGS